MKPAVADYRYRIYCLRIVPVNGTPICLTTHPRDVIIGATTYQTSSGYDFSGYSAEATAAPGLIDLEGIAGYAGIDRDTLASGLFDNARAYLFATTWRAPVLDEEPLVCSILGKTTLNGDRYAIEEMSLVDALNQSVGHTYTPGCSKTFGGQEYAGCGVDLGPVTVSGTLTHITSQTVMRDSARAEAADYFAAGLIRFTTGDNAGLPGKEIKSYAADGTVTIFEPFHYPAQAGDAYELVPGCRKRLQDCRDKWNNVVNFGGFSFVPTTSVYAQAGGQ